MELKAETIVPQGSAITLQMYPKAEADKVIAELNRKIKLYEDIGSCKKGCPALRHNQRRVESEIYKVELKEKEIAELKDKLQNVSSILKETREWLLESQKLHKRCADNAVKVIRHHKYKRCLDMVHYCDLKMSYWANREIYEDDTGKFDLYFKWHERWFKIAEQFREAK